MKSRRDFLKLSALAVAGGLVAPQLFSSCGETAPVSKKNIGIQLYSLRDMEKEHGIEAVLKAVAKMGYKTLETAGGFSDDGKIHGQSPLDLKKMGDDLGLKFTSAHIMRPYNPAEEADIMSWWGKATQGYAQLGVKYLIQPFHGVSDATTADDMKSFCNFLNQVGLLTAGSSIKFGYHNHDFEFKRKIEDQTIYDYMLANTSKDHVTFELDVYWAQKGGYNPVDYMKKYASQIRVLHIKDETEIGASGTLDFKAIYEQAYANGISDMFVEVERYTNNNPEESCQQSFDYLNKAEFVK